MEASVAESVPGFTGGVGSLKRKTLEGGWDYRLQDADALDCPVCYKLFQSPVYQCVNGHSLCYGCCIAVKKVCPSCAKPVGSIRNRTFEKILESVQVPCKNASYGCKEMLKFGDAREKHEIKCVHQPLKCPVVGCFYKGSTRTIPLHLTGKHKVKTVESKLRCGALCIRMQPSDSFVMVKSAKQELFLLHRQDDEDETCDKFFCTSFGIHKRSYDIKVTHGLQSRVYSMRNALAHNIRDWAEGLEELHRDTLVFPKKSGMLRGVDVLIKDLQNEHEDSDAEDESEAEEESEPQDEQFSEPEGE